MATDTGWAISNHARSALERCDLFQDLEELQRSKKAVVGRMEAFAFFGTQLGSRVMTRALYGYY